MGLSFREISARVPGPVA